jgi:polyadenylate-binding protein
VDEISIKGRLVRVMWAQPRAERRKESNYVIYLKNLDRTIGEKTLHDTFSAFGSVISCTLSPASETSIGASIAFDTQDAAKKAIQIVNNSLWNGKKMYATNVLTDVQRWDQY